MTDQAKKGSHLHIALLCGLVACLSIAGYGHPDSHGMTRAQYASPHSVDSVPPATSGPTPDDLAVYVDLHQTRDVSRSAPHARICRE